jgi:hypothetical protein
MSYSVACSCGQRLAVTQNEAGTQKPCACGREVAVPSLRELRQRAGEPVTRTPELVIQSMLRAGTLPDTSDCGLCASPTRDAILVLADCERREPRGSRSGAWFTTLLSFSLFGVIAGWVVSRTAEDDVRVVGENVILKLPLRVCRFCQESIRANNLPTAMRRSQVYAQLLDKYPNARLSVEPGEAQ